jgi:hypothetical protein
MRLVVELLDRFLTLETGRVLYEDAEFVESEEDEDEETPIIHVPMGFTAIAPEEGIDDGDEDEASEDECD